MGTGEAVDLIEAGAGDTKTPSHLGLLNTHKIYYDSKEPLVQTLMVNVGLSLAHRPRRMANMNIYVGNLSLDVTEEELRREFMAFGQVISVVLMNDKYIGSGQTRGYGFVVMASKSESEAAITSLKGKKLRDQTIDVIEALPLSDKRGIGSFHGRINNQFNRKVRQRRY